MVAPTAVPVIFGKDWMPVVGPVRWLAGFMTIRSMNMLAEQVLISQRKTQFTMRLSILTCLFMPLAFIAGALSFGLQGVSASWLVFLPLTMVPVVSLVIRTIHMRLRDYLNSYVPAAVSTGIMCLGLYFGQPAIESHFRSLLIRLAIEVGLGALIYLASILLLFRERALRYINFLRDLRRGKSATPEPATA